MDLTFRTKYVKDLTEPEYAQCMKLTHNGQGSWGSMAGELERQRESNGKAYMAFKGTKLVSWLLGFEENGQWHVYAYTLAKHRKKGIASMLLSRVRMGRRDPIYVYPGYMSDRIYGKLIEQGRAVSAWG